MGFESNKTQSSGLHASGALPVYERGIETDALLWIPDGKTRI